MNRLKIRPDGYILLALMLLILPFQWLVSFVIAVTIHEIGHIFAIFLCGGKITAFSIGIFGANIRFDGLSVKKELICAISGPAASLLLLLVSRLFPHLAVCAFFHCVYNLLPIYPLDGGRAVACLAMLIAPKYAQNITNLISILCKTLILLGCIYAVFVLRLGIWPFAIGAITIFIKKPCNALSLGVQ